MDSFRRLKRELIGYNSEADPERTRAKKILSIIDGLLKDETAELDMSQIPVELLAHIFNSILFPTFIHEMLPDLLHVLSNLEFQRLKVTKKATALLEYDAFLKIQPTSQTSGLPKDDQEYCRHLVNSQDDVREIFINNVLSCCVLDLKLLWLENSNTEFWFRWNEYFSIIKHGADPETLTHPFHYKITPDEINFLRDAPNQLSEFMETTVRAAAQHANKCLSVDDVFRSNKFRQRFLPTFSTEAYDLLTYYVNVVLDAVEKIEAIAKDD